MPPINEQYDAKQQQIIAALAKKIRKIYESSIVNISFTAASLNVKSEKFTLSLYPLLEKKIDEQLKRMNKDVYAAVTAGINQGWGNGNKKNDDIVDKRLAGRRPSKKARQILYDPNKGALSAFLNRKEKGLNLSSSVWNSTKIYKKELAQAIGIGISEGKSAAKMATELKQYLNDPDKLFKRVRSEEGKLKLSTTARNYHPGEGVYRSSYKNALRLTRTETNMAYRSADFNRWQTLPFVLGTEIRLSKNHPRYDICDRLVGKYPKDFVFPGWHPQCMCIQVPVMMSDAEYDELENKILRGDAIDAQSEGQITTTPKGFDNYVKENKKRIANYKSTPYWVKENADYYEKAISTRIPKEERKKSGPAGNAIGDQFTKIDSSIKQKVTKAFELIDSVHGDGILKDIPIKKMSTQGVQASFGTAGTTPHEIKLSTKATDPELSIIHEMGHYLDLYSIGTRGRFDSHERGSVTSKVISAARQTDVIKELQSMADTRVLLNEHGAVALPFHKLQHVKYLLSDHEIFARSYAQYIAVVTNNDKLLDGIKRRIEYKNNTGISYQWEKEDFERIRSAMDTLMEDLGWRISE